MSEKKEEEEDKSARATRKSRIYTSARSEDKAADRDFSNMLWI